MTIAGGEREPRLPFPVVRTRAAGRRREPGAFRGRAGSAGVGAPAAVQP